MSVWHVGVVDAKDRRLMHNLCNMHAVVGVCFCILSKKRLSWSSTGMR